MKLRNFESGATRNSAENKLDYEGFLSPAVLHRFAEYMNGHRVQADGKLRDSDNWQKGIPSEVYRKSLVRHVFDWWRASRGEDVVDPDTQKPVTQQELLCAIMFNVMGLLHEELKPLTKEVLQEAERYMGWHVLTPVRFTEVNPDDSYVDASGQTIYVAGPMTGYVENNFPAFDRARDQLTELGWNVISPADLDRLCDHDHDKEFTQADRRAAMLRDLPAIIGQCTAIFCLDGWEESKGARVETALAEFLLLPQYDSTTGVPCVCKTIKV